jgi:glycogen debranching enzyme
MEWIDAQCRDTGYLSYFRRSTGGIDNQGWKDSGDCIVNGKGQLVEGPIALCEVQAYVYGAKLRSSEMARKLNHSELADRWFSEAQSLKERFNRDFWLESENFCALALDGEGNVVDSITSNPGHCLDLGIFTHEKAEAVAERLLAPDLFSGWGIRTLSALSPAYNPIGYHLGTVWPHDNALIAVGLRSLGRVDRAFAVAQGLFDMTGHQPDRRPPELFCGFERQGDRPPINYPVACSPQAWATGSIFQLLQMMVNPIPDGENHRLTLKNPALPTQIDCLSLRNLRVGSARVDLDFEGRGTETTVKVVEQQGNLEVVVEP